MSTAAQVSSPDRQRTLYHEYCDRWGLKEAGEYADEATSATETAPQDRPGFQALLADARRKRFDLLWCEETSRVARRPEDWFAARAALGRYGVAIVHLTSDPRAEHDTAIAEFTEGLFALLNRYKVAQMGEQISRAQRVRVASGHYRGGHLPPGLAWVWEDRQARRGHYALHEASAPLARRCFELYVDTRCFQQVAKHLTAEGYVSRTGTGLSQPAVKRILQNSAYRGGRYFAEQVYPTALPEIVPPVLVAAADALLAQQAVRPQRATHDYVDRAMFAGLLACPQCGGWLQVHYTVGTRGRAYLAYKCHRARTLPVTCDWRRMVPELTFERAIVPAIIERLRELTLAPRTRERRLRQRAHHDRERLQEERQRVLVSYHKGRIGEAECDALLSGIQDRLDALDDETPEEVTVAPEQVREVQAGLRKHWRALTGAQKRTLLQSVILRVVPNEADWSESGVEWR
jgi:DNA invertase Pin-like site-specific DNA recombinase